MTRLNTPALGAVVLLALFALVASSASAEEKTKMLPESNVSFTIKSGKTKFDQVGGPFPIECNSDTGSGTITSANLGTFMIDFQGCKTSIGTANSCTGSGEAAGVILLAGTFHFWLAKETLSGVLKLIGVLAVLPSDAHFTCTVVGISQLVLLKGCMAALTEPLNILTSVTHDVFVENNGVQLIVKVLSTETAETACELLSSINGGELKQTGLEDIEQNEAFKRGAEVITVLLMNPEAVD